MHSGTYRIALSLAGVALLLATPALAQEARDFCADRPGFGTPACTLAPGTAMIEVGAASWERSRDPATVADTITLGDTLMRLGVGDTTEIQIGLTGHVIQRERDRASGAVDRISGIGDATLAVRQSISGADGPVAVMGFVTVPVAKRPIGNGEWSGGLLLPASVTLAEGFDLELTPEVDFLSNEGRPGHHLAWGCGVGLTRPLSEHLSLTSEVAAFRDDDPDGHSTDARVAASLAWQVAKRLQVDFEADVGLTQGAPDHVLAIGFAWQFR